VGFLTGKYIIGLTGNIATGKSVVRRMLEHLGAYTIDADALSHRAISKGAPGYKPVIEMFGTWILDQDLQINRSRLAELVFHDPEALSKLETIIHPVVVQATKILVKRAHQKVIVIEAIKLFESELNDICDSHWVTTASEQVQTDRLVRKRKMSPEAALTRIRSQDSQTGKIERADVVIQNTGSYEDLWIRVSTAWKQVFPTTDLPPVQPPNNRLTGDYTVLRGKPRDSEAIAGLFTRLSQGKLRMTDNDVMEAFGEKAFLLLQFDKKYIGIAGWQVENLVARTTDLFIEPEHTNNKAIKALLTEVESASHDLQCEVSLAFPYQELSSLKTAWTELGYEKRTPDSLGVQAWQDAAIETFPPGTSLMFKQLRSDRVLRPI